MDKPPHLTLVTSTTASEHDQEFIPLPFYPWSERPSTLALDPDEAATAIHIAKGDVPAAAALLKVPEFRLNRLIRRTPSLQHVLSEANELTTHRAASEYIRALDDPSDRRREWAASKIMASRAAADHPFAPAPAGSTTSNNVTINQDNKEITIHWGEAPAAPEIEGSCGS
jgi:hypothetical protein